MDPYPLRNRPSENMPMVEHASEEPLKTRQNAQQMNADDMHIVEGKAVEFEEPRDDMVYVITDRTMDIGDGKVAYMEPKLDEFGREVDVSQIQRLTSAREQVGPEQRMETAKDVAYGSDFTTTAGCVKINRYCIKQFTRTLTVTANKPFNLPKYILFEDKHIIVLNKPPDMLTQGDYTKEKNLLEETREYIRTIYNKTGNVYLGMIHRLDKQCSGVIVFAKTDRAAARINESFQNDEVTKKYVAVVQGELIGEDECHHLVQPDAPITPHGKHNPVKNRGGSNNQGIDHLPVKEARLKYKSIFSVNTGTVEKSRISTIVDVQLETGRKHQIRAQMAHLGHPIHADSLYGYKNVSVSSVSHIPNPKNYKSYEYDEREFEEFAYQNRFRNVTDIHAEKPTTLIKLLRDSTGNKKGPASKDDTIAVKLPLLNTVHYHSDNSVVELTRQTTPTALSALHKKYNDVNAIYLHAYYLSFPHPFSKQYVSFHAPVPEVWERDYDSSVIHAINTQVKKAAIEEDKKHVNRVDDK